MSAETEPARILTPSSWTGEDPTVEDCPPALCYDPCSDCPLTVELTKQRWGNAYWHQMHQKALAREAKLKEKVAELEAKLRLRERQLFARKSEKENNQETAHAKADKEKKPRGQQKGSPGHGRRNHSHLPVQEEIRDIAENEKFCPCCGLAFELFPGTEDCEVIEIEVKTYRRKIRRRRYKPTCQCGVVTGIVTAPPAPKLIPKGGFGISVWITILLDKFLFLRPTYRFLADLKTHGLDIAQGTITDGLKTIAPLFDPIYEAIIARNLEENRWHADETRWLVFATVEGKVGSRWYLWVFRSPSAHPNHSRHRSPASHHGPGERAGKSFLGGGQQPSPVRSLEGIHPSVPLSGIHPVAWSAIALCRRRQWADPGLIGVRCGRLENGAKRPVHRLDPQTTAKAPPPGRQQCAVSHSPLGPFEKPCLQTSRDGRQTSPPGLE